MALRNVLKFGAPLVLMDAHGDLSAPGTNLLLEAWKHQQNLAGVKWWKKLRAA